MSLDLEHGDEELADATPAERRRAARKRAADSGGGTSTPRPSRSKAAQERVETELVSRLHRTFDRIALALDSRGDEELAVVIREDAAAMTHGLVSLTRNLKVLRSPLLMALNLIEPVLAFGRVGRIMYGRFVARQARVAQERQEATQGMEPSLSATQ